MSIFAHDYPISDSHSSSLSQRLQIAWRHIEFARVYTNSLLEDLTEDDWYWTPDGLDTHIGWQAGHIAMAQYGLTLFFQRGRVREDKQLMSGKFRKLFMRGTTPNPDRAANPQPDEIREVLDNVISQMRIELPGFDGDQLDEAAEAPHAGYATRYGALLFAGDHEMLHAGQIGLLRRMMGKQPLR